MNRKYKVCKKCGTSERYSNGRCRRCHNRRVAERNSKKKIENLPCHQCGSIDRYNNGECAPCSRLSDRLCRKNKAESGECKRCPNKALDNHKLCASCIERERSRAIIKKYNIGTKEYDLMLFQQNGKCLICNSTDPKGHGKYFQIDHDHKTGQIRGLLCGPCNKAIGLLKDSSVIISNALCYVQTSSNEYVNDYMI